jgi:hypothetical protein
MEGFGEFWTDIYSYVQQQYLDSWHDVSVRASLGEGGMSAIRLTVLCLGVCGALVLCARAEHKPTGVASKESAGRAETVNQDWMLEGEKRYIANCGRCHQPPHKFSPKTMAMAVRHMRVRAMLTDEDMRYLLYYMSH